MEGRRTILSTPGSKNNLKILAPDGRVWSPKTSVSFLPAIPILGEAAETIWHQVNKSIKKIIALLYYNCLVCLMFSFEKSPLTMEFSNAEGTKG